MPGKPRSKPRPAFVVSMVKAEDGTDGVTVAYATSQKTDSLFTGEFLISPSDGESFRLAGLSYPTKFDLARTHTLPYTDEWFRVPPNPRYGETPKIGVVSGRLANRIRAAWTHLQSSRPKRLP